ncbi:MAG: hypothetical protein KatS3mg109_2033 [Pirellulaceae bacterium]|nr:MAG: hypothetical protein KatS3mg109_2033 [Pirellulaceae bacterium]
MSAADGNASMCFRCPACGVSLRVAKNSGARRVRCPKCGSVFVVRAGVRRAGRDAGKAREAPGRGREGTAPPDAAACGTRATAGLDTSPGRPATSHTEPAPDRGHADARGPEPVDRARGRGGKAGAGGAVGTSRQEETQEAAGKASQEGPNARAEDVYELQPEAPVGQAKPAPEACRVSSPRELEMALIEHEIDTIKKAVASVGSSLADDLAAYHAACTDAQQYERSFRTRARRAGIQLAAAGTAIITGALTGNLAFGIGLGSTIASKTDPRHQELLRRVQAYGDQVHGSKRRLRQLLRRKDALEMLIDRRQKLPDFVATYGILFPVSLSALSAAIASLILSVCVSPIAGAVGLIAVPYAGVKAHRWLRPIAQVLKDYPAVRGEPKSPGRMRRGWYCLAGWFILAVVAALVVLLAFRCCGAIVDRLS